MNAILRHIDARSDPRAAALMRICLGLLGAGTAARTYRDAGLLLQPAFVHAKEYPWVPDLSAATLPVYTGIFLAASLLFAAGWKTRPAGTVVFGCLVYRLLLDQSLYHSYVALFSLFTPCLVIAGAGEALSLDSLLRTRPQRLIPRWPLTLIRYQISVVYFYTALAKTNAQFLRGDIFRESLPWVPVELPAFWTAVAAGAIVMELSLAFGLWIRATRRWAIAFGSLMHATIPLLLGTTATALYAYSTLFVSGYLLFIDYRPGSYQVIWDDHCGFCRRWVTGFRRLDWLDVLRLQGSSDREALDEAGISPEEASRELKLRANGVTHGGYEAVREILGVLPVTLYWEPFLRLPPVRWAGHRIYRGVAKRRRLLP